MQPINLINKIIVLQGIVQNIIRSNQLYKTLGFLEGSDLNACVIYAETIYSKLKKEYSLIEEKMKLNNFNDYEPYIIKLQEIITEISTLISLYGCDTLENLIQICIGHNFSVEEKYRSKYTLLNTYIKPTRYKILDWRSKLKPTDETICKTADNFECFDYGNEILDINFHQQVYGIKFAIHNIEKHNTLIIYGVIEDVMLDFIENNSYKTKIIQELKDDNEVFTEKSYARFINCLTLKELLTESIKKLQNKYISFVEQFNAINKKSLAQVINEFVQNDLYKKRSMLITLLVNSDENECHYLAYLLYDLLSNDINGIIDTYEQTLIYDSMPFNIKKYFRDVMKQIVNYTNKLSSANISKISLEQRICLMKTNDIVKEKAMVKLKEIKMKTEDTGSKATQFLEGLLKIPFEIYKEEPVLKLTRENIKHFTALTKRLNELDFINPVVLPFQFKNEYTSLEIQKYLPLLKTTYKKELQESLFNQTKIIIASLSKPRMIEIYGKFKYIASQHEELAGIVIKWNGKNIKQLREDFITLITDSLKIKSMSAVLYELLDTFVSEHLPSTNRVLTDLTSNLIQIEDNIEKVNKFIGTVNETLDKSVYGHTNAKRQIERIIGQWLNGDITGYCFGFEGPPGVGKTSLAKKGIAQCLLDENGVARPFAFIAMGGSTNSSTLDGHNYTYVGSTWGRIVDILMDTKIMNPIIFIDELDKVSKTENGKEIIGILTHLIDQTQNDSFQDKYFNGISLNLSKALFIFSYNDVDLIDRILLDRIHRIKFDTISVEDKLIIVRNFILPEIYKKMGLENMIDINDSVIEYIINDYTSEPGVRKLKELMFEIIGEINLDILKKNIDISVDIPIVITQTDIKMRYLKDHTEMRPMKIHTESLVGVINGMWANSVGKGGILPIEASYFPSNTFLDLKLTGMQGEVMKESMTVAKSLAWTLYVRDSATAPLLQDNLEKDKTKGLHIHVPEGATPKDGPSAGTAITMVLYSLFCQRKIKHDVAITGEICLQGRVTAIGGLELKILGGIRAGVKTFIYPKDNEKDFIKFMEKYKKKTFLTDISFFAVERIEEVIPLIFI